MFQFIVNSSFAVTVTIIILHVSERTHAQFCNKTDFVTDSSISCPDGMRFALTSSRASSSGTLYSQTCCDSEKAATQAQRDARGCQTTECLASATEAVNNACSTIDSRIIEGLSTQYEEVLRDDCVESNGKRGYAIICCPPNSPAALILSARGAEPNEFPHQARLILSAPCGGTVYNKDYVVTAAHCVTDVSGKVIDATNVSVILGTNLGNIISKSHQFQVDNITIHQNFSLLEGHSELSMPRDALLHGQQPRTYNDVALLKLTTSINFKDNPDIKALEIAPSNFTPSDFSDKVVIVGWGTTDTLTVPQHLQKADLIIRDNKEKCFKPWNTTTGLGGPHFQYSEFSDQLLCIGGIMDGTISPTAGSGDSGGPAICRSSLGYAVLCGISSFGGDDEACKKNRDVSSCRPSVYTAVSNFRDWLISNAGTQDPSTFHKVFLYGEPIGEGKYLNQVHITSEKGKPCGGTLISPSTVITAAHCVFDDNKVERTGVRIAVGVRDLKDKNVDPTKIVESRKGGINRLETFARWRGVDGINQNQQRMLDNPYVDNIAIIKLVKSVSLPEKDIAKLATGDPFSGSAIEVAFPLNTSRSGTSKRREFVVLYNNDCRSRLGRFRRLGVNASFNSTKVFCGVEKYSGGSTCDRELGGGLFCKQENGEELLCGIQTFRLCNLSLPTAFLNVYAYMSFIQKYL